MRLATALVLTGLIGASATLYTPKAEAGVYVGIGIPAPVVVAPRVVAPVVPTYYGYGPYYGPRVAVGYPRIGYPVRGWGYGGWGYSYHGYAHPGWGHGGGYHYHR
jgi:hypothetical protein